jgi:hypothetical protein
VENENINYWRERIAGFERKKRGEKLPPLEYRGTENIARERFSRPTIGEVAGTVIIGAIFLALTWFL